MSRTSPEERARIGIVHLEEAILDILMNAMCENERISNAEISKRMGIYRGPSESRDWIPWTLLKKLIAENRVIQLPNRGGYALSEQELDQRRNRSS